MACPSCANTNMIFGGHHGMEYNVCESCGTVVESEQFTVDIYKKGCSEVSPDFDGRPSNYGASSYKTYNQKSRLYREALKGMKHLMDGLNLTLDVRETAMKYLTYTYRLNKLASTGACVYLAMKDFNIPITIRYISNYLKVSHFMIGRMMRKLEKRLGKKRSGSNFFGVDELIPLIFSQATFGVVEDRKKMFDLILDKTEKFMHLLQECQATTGYGPHLMILAAGYLVWKNLNIHHWGELKIEMHRLPKRAKQGLTVTRFLSEMGIQISNRGTLTSKILVITELLFKLSEQIPWLSVKKISKNEVVFHLDDFLKYKSQIIDMTAREMAQEKMVNLGNDDSEMKLEKVEEDERDGSNSYNASTDPLNSCLPKASSAIGIGNVSDCDNQTCDAAALSKEDCSESSQDQMCLEVSSNATCQKLPYRKLRFTKVQELLNFIPKKHNNASKVDIQSKDLVRHEQLATNVEIKSNGYNQLLKMTHPKIAQPHKRKTKPFLCYSNLENPRLLFP